MQLTVMQRCFVLLTLAALYSPLSNAQEYSDMGPAAFLWPPDRAYGASQANTAPCGSSAGVTNRTEMPLTNGEVSLVLQDESYNVNLAISFTNDPTSNSDFETEVSGSNFPDLNPGHDCYSLPNPPSKIVSGSNATLQLKYQSTFDTDTNKTYYACADITYIPLSSFTTNVFCMNISVPETSTTSTSTSTSSPKPSVSSGLSGGQIAGIVVGSVVGAAVIVGGLFLLWSRHQRQVQRDKVVAVRMGEWGSQPQKTVSTESGEQA